MRRNIKYFLNLIFFTIFFRALLLLLSVVDYSLFPPGKTDLLMIAFMAISAVTMTIFFSAKGNDAAQKGSRTLLAISLRMLLLLIFALILFVGFKMNNIDTLILFFILYLGFTLFVVFTLLNTLKKESLKK